MAAPNNRIFYAVQAIKMRPCEIDKDTGVVTYSTSRPSGVIVKGIQSVGMTTNFNLEQFYQMGSLEVYDNIENTPDIEVTISKALDGTRTVYNLATDGTGVVNNQTLTEIGNKRCDFALGIWDDTRGNTTGTGAKYYVVCTGMYVSNVSYNFANDGVFTEDVTLVGNHKKWSHSTGGGITHFDDGTASPSGGKLYRRWTLNKLNSILPTGVGTGSSGSIPGTWGSGLHVNSITVSCSMNRESINEMGSRAPYYRFIAFPVEVTSEFEVTATYGDLVDASDFNTETGCNASSVYNLANWPVLIDICPANGTGSDYRIDLGTKNKLSSVNYSGADSGGGNATITYSYQTFNDLKVKSPLAS